MNDKIDDLYLDGKYYDTLYGIGDDQAPDHGFWNSLASDFGGPILELACGTGRVSIPLALAGYSVTGIDIAEGMLREARVKSESAGVDVAWINADICNFDLGKKYQLIILLANALWHIHKTSDFEACLACVRKHLAPGGRFVIDVFVPKMELLVDVSDERFPFGEYDDPQGRGEVVVTHSYVYEPDTQIKRIKTYKKNSWEEGETIGELNLRMYFPQELDALIKYNGFDIENKYGDHEQSAFEASSERQLVVCYVPLST